jgi:hypothetical protein
MKNLFLLIMLTFSVLACSVHEQPVFLRIENIELVEATSKFITVKADAYFKNPNDLGGSLKSDEISVLVNDIKVAQVSSEDFNIPARKAFSAPLKVIISTDSLLKTSSNNILGSLLNSVLNKSIKVQYKGDIIYKTFGFSYTYPIDETENVKIKF